MTQVAIFPVVLKSARVAELGRTMKMYRMRFGSFSATVPSGVPQGSPIANDRFDVAGEFYGADIKQSYLVRFNMKRSL